MMCFVRGRRSCPRARVGPPADLPARRVGIGRRTDQRRRRRLILSVPGELLAIYLAARLEIELRGQGWEDFAPSQGGRRDRTQQRRLVDAAADDPVSSPTVHRQSCCAAPATCCCSMSHQRPQRRHANARGSAAVVRRLRGLRGSLIPGAPTRGSSAADGTACDPPTHELVPLAHCIVGT